MSTGPEQSEQGSSQPPPAPPSEALRPLARVLVVAALHARAEALAISPRLRSPQATPATKGGPSRCGA